MKDARAGMNPLWTYVDLAYLLSAILPSLLLSVLLSKGAALVAPKLFAGKASVALLLQLLFYLFLFLALYLLLRIQYGCPFWSSLGWRDTPLTWLALIAGPILALSIGLLGIGLRAPTISLPFERLMDDPVSVILFGLFIMLLGPLCEELAFRGFLLPLLSRTFGVTAGVLLTALPFAILHGPQYQWSWQHLLLVYTAGAIFGFVRVRAASTTASTALHATYNATFYTLFLLQRI